MQLTVRLFSRSIKLDVEPNETIHDIKTKINKIENIAIELQRIVYLHKPLDDDSKTIQDYNVKPGATFYLMIRVFALKDNKSSNKSRK